MLIPKLFYSVLIKIQFFSFAEHWTELANQTEAMLLFGFAKNKMKKTSHTHTPGCRITSWFFVLCFHLRLFEVSFAVGFSSFFGAFAHTHTQPKLK